MTTVPHPRTYWVEPGCFLAGVFPGESEAGAARAKIAAFLDAGITTFINLMEPSETNYQGQPFAPYAPVVHELARARGVTAAFHRFPIADQGTPTAPQMRAILETVEGALGRGERVFVHCWGGHGRTGMVVGCYLIGQGRATQDDFESVIASLRTQVPHKKPSPENTAQRQFVRDYTTP